MSEELIEKVRLEACKCTKQIPPEIAACNLAAWISSRQINGRGRC